VLYADSILTLAYLSHDRCSSWQTHIRHYIKPSAELFLATSSTLQTTALTSGPGTFTGNITGVLTIIACTKADLIDDNTDLIGAGVSGMGGMVKGKGGEGEEHRHRQDHADTAHNLLEMCVSQLHSFPILMA
jgi:dynein light intermediate chain 1